MKSRDRRFDEERIRRRSEGAKAAVINLLQTSEAAAKCPAELLRLLARDENWFIRSIVAEREDCPPEIQRELALDPDYVVRACLAKNRRLLPELLAFLKKDPVPMVQMAITERRLLGYPLD